MPHMVVRPSNHLLMLRQQ